MTDQGGLLAACLAGVIGGLVLLWRGFAGYLSAARVGDTSTSRIATLAAGEVRVTGVVEPAEVLLTSPLQGRECVWYRASVTSSRDGDNSLFEEERGIGFRLNDGSGSIRVFPRGARLDVPDRFDARDSLLGESPAGLGDRPGPHDPGGAARPGGGDRRPADGAARRTRSVGRRLHGPRQWQWLRTALPRGAPGARRRRHGRRRGPAVRPPRWTRQAPTASTASATRWRVSTTRPSPPRSPRPGRPASCSRPTLAWGNAAIPGLRHRSSGPPAPELDAAATAPALATPDEAARIERTFDLEPDLLVIAAGPDSPLLIANGSPGEVVGREQGRFLLGLLGAVLAIGSAVGAAALLGFG